MRTLALDMNKVTKVKSVLSRFFRKKREEKPAEDSVLRGRRLITRLFLKGNGLEIGALHNPLRVPETAKVKYVDRMSVEDLKKHYPELNALDLVEVDIIDDGERLGRIQDSSQDFVIANHFIEHCQDPLSTLKNLLRVIRSGGILYLAVPDKRFTFDIDRPVTTFDHIEQDYILGPERSRKSHYEEWVRLVNKNEDPVLAEDEVRHLMKIGYSIHFHVWTQIEIIDLLIRSRKYFSFDIEMIYKNEHEVIAILTKTLE